MIVNPFFELGSRTNEQNLLDSLTVEAIQVKGINVAYIARDPQNKDDLYDASDTDSYTRSWVIEVYIKSILGFQGDRDFMSKFAGLEIRDQVVFEISRQRFDTEIGQQLISTRPREGDLLYFPFNKKCFQIKQVNFYPMYYQLGRIYTWELTCELFEYSGETFNTGIPEVDILQTIADLNILTHALEDVDGIPIWDANGDYILMPSYDIQKTDPMADNKDVEFEEDANDYVDWDKTRPFGEWTSDDSTSEEI